MKTNTLTILPAQTSEQFLQIEKLAFEIWRQHYTPIIGPEQVKYMLQKFQTVEAIENEVRNGNEYFMMYLDEKAVGYMGIRWEQDAIFLSKIYVLAEERGKKIGRQGLEFLEKLGRDAKKTSIKLTVNKYNTKSIEAYERMGFLNMGSLVMDIGEGYVMDDYEMEKHI